MISKLKSIKPRKIKGTEVLSEEEYQGIPLSLQDIIQKHVNMEEKLWYQSESIELPKFKKIEVKRNMVGWVNFAKTILFDNVRQLKP